MTSDDHAPDTKRWTFLTSHAHVLLAIDRDPSARVRDIARSVAITERAAQRIIVDLEHAGYLSHTRDGRRNHYTIHSDAPLRHPLNQDHELSELMTALRPPAHPLR